MQPSRKKRFGALLCVSLVCLSFTGCASLTNPIADGLPVRHLPPELLTKQKDLTQTIPLDLLGQRAPDVYRLAPEDVLGVWVEGVLGDRNVPVNVNVAPLTVHREERRLAPSFGYPITVREDGTIRLPLIEPIRVAGLSVAEAEDVIRETYTKKQILPAGRERVMVTLMHPRQTRVVVMRQESGNITLGPEGGLAGGKRSTGHLVDLPGYENDVLHALAQTGGLPGLDACNAVVIFRNSFPNDQARALILEKIRSLPPGVHPSQIMGPKASMVYIPLRTKPGERLPFGPQDTVLRNGDVVFIEARDHDVFYTGGLLPAGEHILPRDYDLDVVKAVMRVRGPLVNGAFGTNQLSGNLIAPGLGGPSPSLLIVLRRTPDGGQVPIRVDLNRALQDPRERILVRPGDVLVLQEKPFEGITRYMTQTFFNFNVVWQVIRGNNVAGVIDIAAPDRLPSRALQLTNP